jgi:hypothetical protein
MVERGVEVARERLRARHRAQQGFPPAGRLHGLNVAFGLLPDLNADI